MTKKEISFIAERIDDFLELSRLLYSSPPSVSYKYANDIQNLAQDILDKYPKVQKRFNKLYT